MVRVRTRVRGMLNTQRIRSAKARLAMKMLRAEDRRPTKKEKILDCE